VEYKLKTISLGGIDEAISKAQLYRYLNEPEEAESICHDVLAADPENQAALRQLGLAMTDQFLGRASDRYAEVESIFQRLTDSYERQYYIGLLIERRAKAQMRAGIPPQAWVGLLQEAMRCFEEAEKIRPAGNDDAMLRWNRCARILQTLPHLVAEQPPQEAIMADEDAAPVPMRRSSRALR
jgi:tetratricopeptide (TPR) repeat protein